MTILSLSKKSEDYRQISKASDNFSHQFMKCEEYIHIKKSQSIGYVHYKCFVGSKDDFVGSNVGTLLYEIRFNRFHKACVYDSNKREIGRIEGRDREWNYSNNDLNIILFDFPSLGASYSNIHANIDKEKYHAEKPKPKGWNSICLNFDYLNPCIKVSNSNFKLLDISDNPVLISCALYKSNRFHCITNLNVLHAFIIFCVKNWS